MKKILMLVVIAGLYLASRTTLANLSIYYAYNHDYQSAYLCQLINHPIQKINNILAYRIPGRPFPRPHPGRPFPKRG